MTAQTPSPPTSVPARGFREWVFGHRLPIGLLVVGFAALVVQPRPAFGGWQTAITAAAITLILVGLAVRAWAGGCAGEHTREATISAPLLVTGGPFAYVRNPIYCASVVLGAGMVMLVGDPVLLALYAAVFIFLYSAIVPAEEKFLHAKFGSAYEKYCSAVPRTWPRSTPWRGAGPVAFACRAILGELRLGLVLGGIYGLLRLGAWLRM